MSQDNTDEIPIKQKLHSETAKIYWHELQRYFAQGVVLKVSSDENLIEVAVQVAENNVDNVQSLLDAKRLGAPTNDQARSWYDDNRMLWSVVVAPFVLVQEEIKS